ncbi:AMP deaminase-like [Chenopodium quinoa]|uniref:AMP deaminase-like n=1 Tax=Chenopodium quinoa TaxID=63459 RepID=UPI000B77FE90|nr:AMP deaminase-like [Chenopodium quinoa]XP_021744887.1 AMP deaminase-like [Chenopodium quinoa]XP_021744888.1 AMP deaminase-like [Chenopodium quinoa]
MDNYTLHLAMAALVGASFVAVSAYYMHRKTLSQLLEFAKTMERDKEGEEGEEGEEVGRHLSPRHYRRRRRIGAYRRASASLPDVTAISGGEIDGSDKRNSVLPVEGIPAGLPRLRSLSEGKATSLTSSSSRSYMMRPTSPKSPVASAFESVEGSDDEDTFKDNSKLDPTYLHTNGNLGPEMRSQYQDPGNNNNGDQVPLTSPNMIRSHSISGDLHGVPPDPIAADILRKEPEQETFVRLKISPSETPTPDEIESYVVLQECLELRDSYVFRETVAPWKKEIITDPSTPKPNPNPFYFSPERKSDHFFQMEDGVVQVYASKDSKEKLFPVADATTFFTDLHHILRVIAAGNIRTLCHHRLNLLEQKFNLHLMLNADREFLAQKSAPHRDFYNVRKVDTHVHHSACMNQKHLLRFIKSKLRKEPDEVVIFRDGTYLTLKEVFQSLDLTGYDLNVDLLDVHADKSTFHRFDKFNLKYNPCGQSRLREIFLKQDNLIQGRFLGELTKQVFSDLVASKYQMAEYRVSIYGRKQSEWDQLASWVVNNDLYSENVVWLIQIPRLYNVYKDMGIVTSFQNMLDNIFLPLFEVTVDPNSHPHLHLFLKQLVGLDIVDDESKPERRPTKHMPAPDQWTNIFNPAFSYYAYYCYANLYTLNKLRESKGMTTIKFRPHAGEAGDIDHLAATFLTAHNIAHGINLRKSPVLQYLYYLAQIGLAMSPLSNNSLFLDYHRNPFPMFFLRGLNVSLSTDDPLQIHLTKEPLVEEYSIAASVWKLSSCDLCEIARNSVLQSGFSHALKRHWIGERYFKRGPDGNDIHKTNVPHIRVEFRHMIWREEMQQVFLGKANIPQEVDK